MTTMIDAVDKIVVITGAGFSAPSGLPVYRGSGTGWIDGDLEQKMRANRYGNHLQELWPHWHALAAKANNAEPNLAHLALTRWEELVTARGGWPISAPATAAPPVVQRTRRPPPKRETKSAFKAIARFHAKTTAYLWLSTVIEEEQAIKRAKDSQVISRARQSLRTGTET